MSRVAVKTAGKILPRWSPPKGERWTGFCLDGRRADNGDGTSPYHTGCRGAFLLPGNVLSRCACPCHSGDEVPRDMDAEIRAARLSRALASGRSAVTVDRITGKRTKTHCKWNHEMTPENTGPGNVCRTCKREASARVKDKRARGTL